MQSYNAEIDDVLSQEFSTTEENMEPFDDHLPSSDPGSAEYDFRHHHAPAIAHNVGLRRARALVASAQDVPARPESERHQRSAKRERSVAKKPFVSATEYDKAMEVILWYGRQVPVDDRYAQAPANECQMRHYCRACGWEFWCGFVGYDIGCPYKKTSWAFPDNYEWRCKMHSCNQCISWVDHLFEYNCPTALSVVLASRDIHRRGPFNHLLNDVQVERQLNNVQVKSAAQKVSSLKILRVSNQRRVQEDRAYYRRRARNLHAAGLPDRKSVV